MKNFPSVDDNPAQITKQKHNIHRDQNPSEIHFISNSVETPKTTNDSPLSLIQCEDDPCIQTYHGYQRQNHQNNTFKNVLVEKDVMFIDP